MEEDEPLQISSNEDEVSQYVEDLFNSIEESDDSGNNAQCVLRSF